MKAFLFLLATVLVSFSTIETSFAQTNNEEIPVAVDKMPEFPGGQVALVKYISKNIKYPQKYKSEKLNARVFVSFIIDKDGKVVSPKIVKSLNAECDAEALRVISKMPDWIPGEKNGQKVAVKFGLPVNFE